ncbi:MAG: tetratricopeptide repeat protein [Acidobacteriota bacterium]|nr:tetratricopeptide repeat protein [Acidobacteriota bacterium]
MKRSFIHNSTSSFSAVAIGMIGLILLCAAPAARAQYAAGATETVVVLPFENGSKAPGLEWIGEAFPEIIGRRLASSTSLFVVPRSDRVYALDRLGIPASARPSLATLLRLGEEMDADYLVMGRYAYDGQTFTATAQLLDMKKLRLSPEVKEAGPLPKLLDLQLALTWDMMRVMNPGQLSSRNAFVAAGPSLRLDALEKYIRGVIASDRGERLRNLREAVRLNPSYAPAVMQLARTYYDARDYANAASWFARIPAGDALAREAQFYLGMSQFYTGDYVHAQVAFDFVATRLPLTEVYNNLGVVAGRRGLKSAAEYFQRAVQADPSDADYHFNLAVALARAGDTAAAVKQLRQGLELRPGDAEAKAFLDQLVTPVNPGASGGATAGIAGKGTAGKLPLERIKSNYDEASFRQLALEIENLNETRLAKTDTRTHANFHVQHGRQMLAANLLTVAEKDFREAVLLDPANAGAHAGLARVLELTSDTVGARAEARSSIQLQPSANAFLVLARLDLRDNRTEAAGESVDKALQLEPANAAAQALKSAIAAKLAEKGQPLRNP